jgi:hypothetical protein
MTRRLTRRDVVAWPIQDVAAAAAHEAAVAARRGLTLDLTR